jgi:hypothetical protein
MSILNDPQGTIHGPCLPESVNTPFVGRKNLTIG